MLDGRQNAPPAVEFLDAAGRLEEPRSRFDLDAGDGDDRWRHLRGHELIVDERVKAILIRAQVRLHALGSIGQIGRPNRLVGFLGALARLVRVRLRGQIRLPVSRSDVIADHLQGVIRNARAVGTHVGNEGDRSLAAHLHALIELLGEIHRDPRRQAQPLVGGLLQSRRRERGGCPAVLVLLVHLRDDVSSGIQHRIDRIGLLFRRGGEFIALPSGQLGLERSRRDLGGLFLPFWRCFSRRAFGLVALALAVAHRVGFGEPRFRGQIFAAFLGVEFRLGGIGGEFHGSLRREQGRDFPIFLGLEGFDFTLAVDNQLDRDRLHSAGTQSACYLLSEQVRERIAHDAVQHPSRFLGLDPLIVDGGRVGDRPLHRGASDFVEGDPLRRLRVELQCFGNVPGDRFAFTIRVSGQVDHAGLVGFALQLRQNILSCSPLARTPGIASVHDDIARFPASCDVDADDVLSFELPLRRQIADVTVTRQDLEIGPEIFLDRFRFGWRFHDNEVFSRRTPGFAVFDHGGRDGLLRRAAAGAFSAAVFLTARAEALAAAGFFSLRAAAFFGAASFGSGFLRGGTRTPGLNSKLGAIR